METQSLFRIFPVIQRFGVGLSPEYRFQCVTCDSKVSDAMTYLNGEADESFLICDPEDASTIIGYYSHEGEYIFFTEYEGLLSELVPLVCYEVAVSLDHPVGSAYAFAVERQEEEIFFALCSMFGQAATSYLHYKVLHGDTISTDRYLQNYINQKLNQDTDMMQFFIAMKQLS